MIKQYATYKGCFPASPFLTTRSTTSPYSITKLKGPYALSAVAFSPKLITEKSAGTFGGFQVISLNIARLVPSSMVSNSTSKSMVFVTGGCDSTTTGTRARSSISWYSSMKPESVNGADALYVTEDVISTTTGVKSLKVLSEKAKLTEPELGRHVVKHFFVHVGVDGPVA